MIKKCTEKDKDFLLKYLYKHKELNLFVIGDIYNFGFSDENQEIWVDIIDDSIKTVYLRYFNNLVVVSYEKIVDNNFILDIVTKYSIVNINGEKSVIDLISINDFTKKECYFSALNKFSINVDSQDVDEIKNEELNEYFDKIDEVFKTKNNRESAIAGLKNKSERIYVYRKDGEIVSSAKSSAECDGLAMIVGVFTIDGHRRKGYALKTVYKLCDMLLKDDKTVCLFYDNPNAAIMYEKIGFKFIGYYTLLRKNL